MNIKDFFNLDKETQKWLSSKSESDLKSFIDENITAPLESGEYTLGEIKEKIDEMKIPSTVKDMLKEEARTQDQQSKQSSDKPAIDKLRKMIENFIKNNKPKDYLTPEEKQAIIKDLYKEIKTMIPVPGRDYPSKEDINQYVDELFDYLKPKDGEPGKDAVIDYEEIWKKIEPKLPKQKEIKPETTLELVRRINQIQEEIDPSAVKGLVDLFILVSKIEKGMKGLNKGGGVSLFTHLNDTPYSYAKKAGYVVTVNAGENGLVFSPAGGSSNFVEDDRPTGLINGSNKGFTLAQTPISAQSVQLYLNGQLQTRLTDFTIIGKTVTFENAPPLDSVLQAWYRI